MARRMDLWRTTRGLYAVQVFLNRIFFALLKHFDDMHLFLLGKNLLCNERSENLNFQPIVF